MKTILLLTILNFIICEKSYCYCQQDSLKLKVIEHLIIKGELKDIEDKAKYFDNIYITDLLKTEKSSLEDHKDGLYKFGTFSSHSHTFIMAIKENDITMMDLNNLDEVLVFVIEFLKGRNKSPKEILDNIEEILTLYKSNLSAIPWTN